MTIKSWLTVAVVSIAVFSGPPVMAAPAPTAQATQPASAATTPIADAIAERRFADAARMLDEALLRTPEDLTLQLLSGDLLFAKGQPTEALRRYKAAERLDAPSIATRALEGQGLCLAALGRYDEAEPLLKRATSADPRSWRGWNALGATYDQSRRWAEAEAAFAQALKVTTDPATVLNNRGYSRMLQGRLDLAKADFMAALRRDPGSATARGNLRLALAMGGAYDSAIAGATVAEKAALLNNAGFAAALRGDYPRAKELLAQAQQAKGEFYGRALGNLQLAEDLASRTADAPMEPTAPAASAAPAIRNRLPATTTPTTPPRGLPKLRDKL